MGGSTKAQTIGYRYYMAVHMGISRGPIDEIVEIRIGDKMAFPVAGGSQILDGPNPPPNSVNYTITDTGSYPINAPNLFGGDKGEGGIEGTLRVFMGKKGQIVDADIKNSLGGDVPDFRNITTCYYEGLICSLNPYPKVWKYRARRSLKGWDGEPWYPEKARISMRNGAIIAMNPAHMIYEAATNRDWGRGWPRSRIDDASFRRAADTLFSEQFGLCLRYNRQDALSSFVQEVLNHVQAVVYTSRETGLLTFDLIRNNYDAESIPLYTYGDGLLSVEEPEVATREDVVNELIVKFKDPIRNEERSIRVHNLASIQSQRGARNTNTVEYPGIPIDELANRIAARDLRIGAVSGRRYTVILNRDAWKMFPSKVFRIKAPDKGIENLILRAGKVEHKSIDDGQITVTAVPDIFGMPSNAYTDLQTNFWNDPDRIAKAPLFSTAREMNYRDLFNNLSRADLAQIAYTESYVGAFATKPSPLSLSFSIETKTSSETEYGMRDTDSFSPAFVLSGPIDAKTIYIPYSRSYDANGITLPCAGQIDDEIIRIDNVTPGTGTAGVLTVTRGCVDTLPAAHTTGRPVILFDGFTGLDQREYAAGEAVSVRLRTNTSTEELDETKSPVNNVSVTGRQGRPYSGANMKINNVTIYDTIPKRDDILINWSHRDRITLQDKLLGFFEGDFVPETGTTYSIVIYDNNKTYRVFENITNNQITYTKDQQIADSLPGNNAQFFIKLITVRDNLQSYSQPVGIAVRN